MGVMGLLMNLVWDLLLTQNLKIFVAFANLVNVN